MNSRLIGGILLILGTSIGAGLLALPIACAQQGFWVSVASLIVIWFAMTVSAFLLLEVNLSLPENSNLISMARATLGKSGAAVMWIAYLLLLYALLSAYIASSSDILYGFFGSHIPQTINTILITALLGLIVYRGIYSVDMVNRGLMSAKLIIYALIIMAIAPHASWIKLNIGHSTLLIRTLMVISTSFGFAIIIPSLRRYFKSDVKKLRLSILIGSLIPLIFYILWIAVVQGALPLHGQYSLNYMATSGHATSDLARGLSHHLKTPMITTLAHTFTSICALTSFLGVSLALIHFLSDGLSLPEHGKKASILYMIAYLPPVLIVLIAPGIFIAALSYAGIFCVTVLMLMPALMVWGQFPAGTVHTECLPDGRNWGQSPAGTVPIIIKKILLILIIALAITLIGWEIINLI